MGEVIAIANEKGGVGKTTTATAMSAKLAMKGYKVAHIDYDGQGHSTFLFGVTNPNMLEITTNTLIRRIIEEQPLPPIEDYVIKTPCGVDLIPSNSQLYTLERNLCFVDFRERVLSQYIDTIRDLYDYIIIDCMPQIGTPMINAFMCADSIIIPTQAELSSAQGLTELMKHYQTIRKYSNHKLRIDGILITMDSPNTILSKKVSHLIRKGYESSIPIFKTHIPRSIKVGEAYSNQMTICEYMPDNPAAIAYDAFVQEFLAHSSSKKEEAVSVNG